MSEHGSIEEGGPEPVKYDPVIFKVGSILKVHLSYLKYMTFIAIGISLLWPWNCFLAASAYYGERFAHSPSLIKIYSSTMMSISTVTSTLFNYYLSQSQSGVNYNHRVNFGLTITIGVFVLMALTCVTNIFIRMKDSIFFTMLMLTVLVSSMATCLAQNGTMAIVNVWGGIYANAVMVGQAIAGVLPSIALIASILIIGENNHRPTGDDYFVQKNFGVFFYYITASLISIVAMFLLQCTNFYNRQAQYQSLRDTPQETDLSDEDQNEVPMVQSKHVPFSLLWSKLKLIVSTIFLTFSITLVFPVFASTVESTHVDSKNVFFQKKIFIPFIYLIWSLGDLLGRILCGTPNSIILIKSPKKLILYSLARILFIPLFLTCNIHPYTASGKSSAVIDSDLWYIFLQLSFGLTNGQLCTSCFMIVGDYCDNDDEKEAAGGFTTVFLSCGLAFGSIFSYLFVLIIS
ncbi:uncharacterized protein PRCAT00002732001 [Priceomyces carsonii]|uniref:uncharacterized protein n=1 Tax=Priceomyces carsonii TaxID=28549 RepID=UPI002ED7C238|nr:unnamed protein product [Priceomyces carsonii]